MAQDLLRFTTAGSVDDGKSTLIGRLLYDARVVYDDQAAALRLRDGVMDFARLTDGLRAEREQGITIDVAYRYFSTPRRRFIIADTPGHEQYTRNMATGASTASAAVILVDAARGLQPQTRRHVEIARLLGIHHVIAAINKMDLVDHQERRYRELARAFTELCTESGTRGTMSVTAIPVSAVAGDNVVTASTHMPWYAGPSLLALLEALPATHAEGREAPWRLPIQMALRTAPRRYAGQLPSGRLDPGARAVVLPSRERVTIVSIWRGGQQVAHAASGDSVAVTLDRDVDLGRGDWLVPAEAAPHVTSHVRAALVWMHPQAARGGATYLMKQTTRTLRARLDTIAGSDMLAMNAIASSTWQTSAPLYCDRYAVNRATGAFIVIDPVHFGTVGAGMIEEALPDAD